MVDFLVLAENDDADNLLLGVAALEAVDDCFCNETVLFLLRDFVSIDEAAENVDDWDAIASCTDDDIADGGGDKDDCRCLVHDADADETDALLLSDASDGIMMVCFRKNGREDRVNERNRVCRKDFASHFPNQQLFLVVVVFTKMTGAVTETVATKPVFNPSRASIFSGLLRSC